jgi:hypothetical protein
MLGSARLQNTHNLRILTFKKISKFKGDYDNDKNTWRKTGTIQERVQDNQP